MKTIIALGGGELKAKETLEIDRYIAAEARKIAGERRPYGLFIPTASHDFMPYFNSFRKTYTSVFDIKADVALTVFTEMSPEKIKDKFDKADFIYIGGGDTLFMLDSWRKSGLLQLILDAYNGGKLICGLSAGAICWFDKMYTDSLVASGKSDSYEIYDGLGLISGLISPHYDRRIVDFDEKLRYYNGVAYAIEDNCAIKFVDGVPVGAVSAGGKAYRFSALDGKVDKQEIKQIT